MSAALRPRFVLRRPIETGCWAGSRRAGRASNGPIEVVADIKRDVLTVLRRRDARGRCVWRVRPRVHRSNSSGRLSRASEPLRAWPL